MNSARRQWLVGLSSLGAGAILLGCNKAGTSEKKEAKDQKDGDEAEVTATEDLMRMYEHHAAIEDTVVFPAWKQTPSIQNSSMR